MIRELFESLENNPIFSGGLTLMLIGSAAALLRNFPASSGRSSSAGCRSRSRSPTAIPPFAGSRPGWRRTRTPSRARDLSLTTTWVSTEPDPTIETGPYSSSPSGPASQAKFLLSPAPGIHIMMYRRRILILSRVRHDHQNNGPMTFHESIRLQLLGGSRKLIDELLGRGPCIVVPPVARREHPHGAQ